MRKAHRYIAIFAVLFGLYVSCSGLLLQAMDLTAVLSHAPATSPTMRAIHVGIYGPPNFQVLSEPDYTAPAIPSDFGFDPALASGLKGGRAAVGGGPINYLEFRTLGGKVVEAIASHDQVFTIDTVTGSTIGAPHSRVLPKMETPSLRNQIKAIHRFRAYGRWAIAIDLVAGLLIIGMIVTGGMVYWQLLKVRWRMRRKNPFWRAGGTWKSLHRATAFVSAFFLLIIAVTGVVITISSLGVARQGGVRPVITADLSKPLLDAELPAMLHTTLAAYRAAHPGLPIRVLRLRYFAGMPQGVVVSGGDREAEQFVYQAVTGREVSLTEPNYPAPGQTFGWQVDETFKEIHRGDYFGLTGRGMSVLSGFALLYLSISGIAMYYELWSNRRRRGRHGLFWSR